MSEREQIARALVEVTNRWIKPNFPEAHKLRGFDELDEQEQRLNLDYADAALGVMQAVTPAQQPAARTVKPLPGELALIQLAMAALYEIDGFSIGSHIQPVCIAREALAKIKDLTFESQPIAVLASRDATHEQLAKAVSAASRTPAESDCDCPADESKACDLLRKQVSLLRDQVEGMKPALLAAKAYAEADFDDTSDLPAKVRASKLCDAVDAALKLTSTLRQSTEP